MKSSTTNMLLIGGAGLGLLYFISKPATATTSPTGVLAAGAPPPPATFDQTYYNTYEYPAMLAANPNIGNPNYTLTPAEATQYYNNYLELQQWAATVVPKPFATLQQAMQYHWKTYGVADKYSFMPFIPPKNANWTPPPVNPNASSSGSSTLTTALSVAGTVVALLGTDDSQTIATPLLNNAEVEVVITGSAIALQLLPFYYGQSQTKAYGIEDRIKNVLEQYTR